MDSSKADNCFIRLTDFSTKEEIPEQLGYPFYYTPHPLAIKAALQLQEIIEEKSQTWSHNFGLHNEENAIGKMFGVLVVQDQEDEIGFLAGFSGKLADSNDHEGFVPPVFDMLTANGFFRPEEIEINDITLEIEQLENHPDKHQLEQEANTQLKEQKERIQQHKQTITANKQKRKAQRHNAEQTLSSTEMTQLLEQLAEESKKEQLQLKWLTKTSKEKALQLDAALKPYKDRIQELKELRKNKSAQLQQRLFESYTFLNSQQETRSLLSIFEEKGLSAPPAGAGECSAPKLFQYAFLHGYKPLALAEFWWGKSPASEVRVHRQFYPACRGKCEPILNHMLTGLNVEQNPMLQPPDPDKVLNVLYEDEYLIAIDKPHELLSVPGKNIVDSAQVRLQAMFPDLEGPFLVHRLDMSTSGVLIAAKTMQHYKLLQRQFIKHHIQKKYIALLDGTIQLTSGYIHFPLRVDLDDRPRQLACYQYGKAATTKWHKIGEENGATRIQFEPITGRTHQLRVHSAHRFGLNCPIKGDDLYGTKADRLYLHAHELIFTHPVTRKKITVTAPIPF